MANPFYIPQGPSVSERVLPLFNQSNEIGIQRDRNRLMNEDLMLKSRATDLKAQELEQENKKIPLSRQNFGANESKLLGMVLDKYDPKGALKKIGLQQDFDLMSQNPTVDKGYVYSHYKQNWGAYKDRIAEAFAEKGMDQELTPYLQEHYKKLAQVIKQDENGAFLDRLMPNVAREYQMENAKIASSFQEKLPASAIQEYNLARSQGYPGSFVDFMNQQSGGKDEWVFQSTTDGIVAMNKRNRQSIPMTAPTGQTYKAPTADINFISDKESAIKEADRVAKLKETMPKSRETLSSLERQWDIVDKTIDKALKQVSPFSAGIGAWSRVVPTSPAKDLSENLNTIKANIGFDKLQQMRADSPTGGALGQVSDFENKLLQAVQGSLDQSQSVPQLIENLTSVKGALQALRAQKRFAFDYDFREVRPQGQQEQTALPDGLSPEDVQYNMTKYGKSRQEVIDQFNKKRGTK